MFRLDSPKFLDLCQRRFHPGTRAKGGEIRGSGRVLSCEVKRKGNQYEIIGMVRGTSPEPYEVDIECGNRFNTVFLNANCTCPMLENCKHIYAVLLQATDEEASAFSSPPPRQLSNVVPLPEPPQTELSPDWEAWLERVAKGAPGGTEDAAAAAREPDQTGRLFYVLKPAKARQAIAIEFFQGRLAPDGAVKSKSQVYLNNVLHASAGGCVLPSDRILARKIFLMQAESQFFAAELRGEMGVELLEEILATGRCYWRSVAGKVPALTHGPARAAKAAWRTDDQGWQEPVFEVTPPAAILPLSPPWYLDEKEGLCGRLETGLPPEVAGEWLIAPKLAPEQSHLLWQQLPACKIDTLPLPAKIEVEITPPSPPVPCLRLLTTGRPERFTYFDEDEPEPTHLARLEFDYSGMRVSPRSPRYGTDRFENNRLRRITPRPPIRAGRRAAPGKDRVRTGDEGLLYPFAEDGR